MKLNCPRENSQPKLKKTSILIWQLFIFVKAIFVSSNSKVIYKSLIVSLLILLFSLAHTQNPLLSGEVLKGIVVGDGLNWESNELNVTVTVTKSSQIGIKVYSPGFDPDDYRAEWQGGQELGDERYDQGRGEVRAEFILSRGNEVVASKSYGIESHRVDVLFNQTLSPGDYVLTSRFYGKGKNSFIYGFETSTVNALELYVEAYEAIVDPIITNYNIARGQWQVPFSIKNRTGRTANIWIYDGDGPYELLFKLKNPRGEETDQAVSGDLEWLGYPLPDQGDYDFQFLVPDSAYQYTNTIGLRADCRLRILKEGYECVTPAVFEITKSVTPTHVQRGQEVTYQLNVTNVGGSWGTAQLEDILPKELEGENLNVTLDLNSRETKTYTIKARVKETVVAETPTIATSSCNDYYSYCETYNSEIVTGEIINTGTIRWERGSASASASIYIVEPPPPPGAAPPPPIFTLSKETTQLAACTGDVITYVIRVSNTGGSAGQVLLEDVLPESLEGRDLSQNIVLAANETQEFTISGVVKENAPDLIVNRVILRSVVGDQSAEATVRLDCPPPPPEPTTMVLIKEVNPSIARAGDRVTFVLTARNSSNVKREFVLEDNLPEGIEGKNFSEGFPLEAGESRTFRIDAVVADWVEGGTEIINFATLSAEGHSVTATATVFVESVLVAADIPPPPPPAYELKKRAIKENLEQGEEAVFEIEVTNTGGSEGEVTIRDMLPEGIEGEDIAETFMLEAGQGKTITVKGKAVTCGELTNTAILRSGAGNQRAEAIVTVICPPALPDIEQTRFSDIDLVFGSEGEIGLVDTVLITHQVPAGSEYKAGTSRLNGTPMADPIADETGRLYWVLGPMTEGRIRYHVIHKEVNLPPVEDPTFTIRAAEREIMIVGDVSFSDLIELGVEREVTVARKTVGEELTLANYQLNVGNRQPIEVGVELSPEVVANLVAQERPYITVGANLEFIEEDARPSLSGYQVELVDNKALLRFEPQPTVKRLELELGYGNTIKETRITLLGAEGGFYQYHLHARGRLLGGDLFGEAFAQGYAELAVGGGRLQAAVDVGVNILEFEFDNAELDADRGLKTDVDPIDRYHLTGSGTEAQPALRSDDGIAARYDNEVISLGYSAGSTDVPGINSVPSLTAGWVETKGDIRARAFVGVVAEGTEQVIFGDPEENTADDFLLDGTRSYSLGESVEASSEELVLITVEGEKVLKRLKDYSIDYSTGLITLAEPLWSVDETFNPIRLQITYAPRDAKRDDLAYGAGVEYKTDEVKLAVGFMNIAGRGFDIGGEIGYTSQDFNLEANYKGNLQDEELNSHATLNSRGKLGPFEAFAKLTYNDNFDEYKFRGDARVAYRITPANIIALEQQFGWGHTGLVYEHVLGRVVLGGGIGYEWPTSTYKALLRGGYWSEAFSFGVTHSQPLDTSETARTDASFRYKIDDNLSFRALVFSAWGSEVGGTIGLDQSIGGANLSLDYSLPTGSAESNRARFGVEAPVPLGDNLDLDLTAGYERDFDENTGHAAFGGALRYKDEGLKVTIGGEIAISEAGDIKVTLRGGVAGQLARDQTISLSANYQISPDVRGRADLAYALKSKRLQLLTYHSLIGNDDENILKGELAPTYVMTSTFQIRPSIAYRVNFDDDEANAFQFSVGGVYYFDADFATIGLGAYGHYILTGGGDSNLAASIELMAQLIENLWVTVGYTFTEASGVTSQTKSGLYFGIDLIGGNQF